MALIEDHAMKWKYAWAVQWFHQALGILKNTGVSEGAGGATELTGAVAAAEMTRLPMATADELYFAFDCVCELGDFDLTKDIHCQVLFDTSGGAADTGIDFTAHAKGLLDGVAWTDTKVSADGTITFPAKTTTAGTGSIEKTAWQAFDIGAAAIESDEVLGVAITLADSGDASADEIGLLAVRLRGERQACTDRRQQTGG